MNTNIKVTINWQGPEHWKEVRRWLHKNVGATGWYTNGFSTNIFMYPTTVTVWFAHEHHAVHFLLRWS